MMLETLILALRLLAAIGLGMYGLIFCPYVSIHLAGSWAVPFGIIQLGICVFAIHKLLND